MTDSPDTSLSLEAATDRLKTALSHLDARLSPILTRLQTAETQLSEASGFDEDRARLARNLDEVTARAEAAESRLRAREDEFAALSRDTRHELDQTIATLRDTLDEAG
jgi:predicted  nucleic acid-binding Zn-ribbon protein